LWLHLAQHILVMCILSVVHIQKFTIRYDFKVTTTAGGDPIIISWRCLMLVKLEWLGYRLPYGEKSMTIC